MDIPGITEQNVVIGCCLFRRKDLARPLAATKTGLTADQAKNVAVELCFFIRGQPRNPR